jgi:oxygen-independent coproporphyrinogen III oxidase
MNPGLYIHIPFCRAKCGYCDFYSSEDTRLIDDYMKALSLEMESYKGEFKGFDTIYIGGGTPSLLTLNQLWIILRDAGNTFGIVPGAEITVEINPADWGEETLRLLYELSVNRISIGVQSFSDQELTFLGRRHDSSQASATLEAARKAGFENIGIDLIYGLPGQTFSDWQGSLAKAIEYGPEHLSCYELEIKHDTPLGMRYHRGEFIKHTERALHEFFIGTSEDLEAAGYLHYEISNFARGMEKASRHNQKYWDHTPYLGLGPSAHSFMGRKRWWNHGSLTEYLKDLEDRRRPVAEMEELNDQELAMEALFLGLRMKRGIDTELFLQRFGIDIREGNSHKIQEWVRLGLIETEGPVIRPTRAGMAVADALVVI